MCPNSHEDKSKWEYFETLPDIGSAEVRIGFLERNGVPAQLASEQLSLGLEDGYRVYVPSRLLHRAKWLAAQTDVSDAELNFLATGELDEADSSSS